MPTLKYLLYCRIQDIKLRLPNPLQVELYLSTPSLEAEFDKFIQDFLLVDIRQGFLQEVSNKIDRVIRDAFNRNNLSLIISNYPSIAESIITQLFKIIHEFYINTIIKPWEAYVASADQIEPNLTALENELKNLISKINFPIEQISTEFDNVNEVYMFNAIDSIIKQVSQDIHNINCASLYLKIKNEDEDEDAGADEKIIDAIMLNALLMLNEIELYIDPDNCNTGRIKEVAFHYFMQFQLRVANPITLYSVDPLFVEQCRIDCLQLATKMPDLISGDSMPNSTYTSPNSSPRASPRKW